MNKIIIIILISYTSIFAQIYPEDIKAINPDTTITISINKNVDLIRIVSKMDSKYDEVYGIYNLKIYNAIDNSFIQEINDTMSSNLIWANIKLFDVNLDNYLDIALVNVLTDQGFKVFDFWVYDNKSKSFKYNPAYSDLCCNMSIDTLKNKIFIDYYDIINGYSEDRTYQITPNAPVLTNYRTTQDFKTDGIDSVLIKEYEVTNGKYKLLKQHKALKLNGWQ